MMMPKWFHDFWLCDLNPAGIEAPKALQTEHATSTRRVNVLGEDFNEKVYEILNSGQITERKATFALLDQRTFQCEWRAVEALSLAKCTASAISATADFGARPLSPPTDRRRLHRETNSRGAGADVIAPGREGNG
jgi:hypothetical protein